MGRNRPKTYLRTLAITPIILTNGPPALTVHGMSHIFTGFNSPRIASTLTPGDRPVSIRFDSQQWEYRDYKGPFCCKCPAGNCWIADQLHFFHLTAYESYEGLFAIRVGTVSASTHSWCWVIQSRRRGAGPAVGWSRLRTAELSVSWEGVGCSCAPASRRSNTVPRRSG